MRRQGPERGKFPGTLKSAQTFSADSRQACEHLQALDRDLKASRTSRTLGRGQRIRMRGPREGKVSWHLGIGENFFCRLAASLRVICKR